MDQPDNTSKCTLNLGYLTTLVLCEPALASTSTLSIVGFMSSTRSAALPVIARHMVAPLNNTDLAQLLHSSMGQNDSVAVISLSKERFATLDTLQGSRSMVLSILHEGVAI
ncbi:hypothetical protein INT44_007165 [Umbelopsis vinacea]|uniref:Uncharacterized protein n=1 Tax=Umbelopsis vinacea TaxID=44442 RepID=A0A8H7UBK0_9FUNG|nr:hypothetical protein INT44_007165 [Umbelopsis vinacea]